MVWREQILQNMQERRTEDHRAEALRTTEGAREVREVRRKECGREKEYVPRMSHSPRRQKQKSKGCVAVRL